MGVLELAGAVVGEVGGEDAVGGALAALELAGGAGLGLAGGGGGGAAGGRSGEDGGRGGGGGWVLVVVNEGSWHGGWGGREEIAGAFPAGVHGSGRGRRCDWERLLGAIRFGFWGLWGREIVGAV